MRCVPYKDTVTTVDAGTLKMFHTMSLDKPAVWDDSGVTMKNQLRVAALKGQQESEKGF